MIFSRRFATLFGSSFTTSCKITGKKQKKRSFQNKYYTKSGKSSTYFGMNAFVHVTYSIINAGIRQASCKKILPAFSISYNLHRKVT